MGDLFLRSGRGLVTIMAVFWLIFLVAPIVVTLGASFTSSTYLTFPPPGYSVRWYLSAFESEWVWSTFWNSVVIAVVSTAIAVALGIAAARVLARHRFYGRGAFEYAVLSPLIIPGVVVGFALLNVSVLIETQDAGLLNLIIGHSMVTTPFTLRSVWSSMAGSDLSLEEAAQSLGATRWSAFWLVVFPLIVPGIVAGAIIAFTFSFNDVTISAFLSAREARTLPVELMSHIEYLPDPTPAAVSSLMIVITLAFFLLVERTVGLDVFADR